MSINDNRKSAVLYQGLDASVLPCGECGLEPCSCRSVDIHLQAKVSLGSMQELLNDLQFPVRFPKGGSAFRDLRMLFPWKCKNGCYCMSKWQRIGDIDFLAYRQYAESLIVKGRLGGLESR